MRGGVKDRRQTDTQTARERHVPWKGGGRAETAGQKC